MKKTILIIGLLVVLVGVLLPQTVVSQEAPVHRSGIVVAPSDAPQRIKDGADFVADGTDDHVEINQALVQAETEGLPVILEAGIFQDAEGIVIGTGQIFSSTDRMGLYGRGAQNGMTIVKLKDNATLPLLTVGELYPYIEAVLVRDIWFYGNRGNQLSEIDGVVIANDMVNVELRDIVVDNFSGNGLEAQDARYLSIQNSWFSYNVKNGINAGPLTYHYDFVNLVAGGNGNNGIFTSGKRGTILGGDFSANGVEVGGSAGIYVYLNYLVNIDGGRFLNENETQNQAHAIKGYGVYELNISNIITENMQNHHIYLNSVFASSVKGNMIRGGGVGVGAGIYSNGNSYSWSDFDNTIFGSQAEGMVIATAYNRISGNIYKSQREAVKIYGNDNKIDVYAMDSNVSDSGYSQINILGSNNFVDGSITRLKDSSPAYGLWDAGTNTLLGSNDFRGGGVLGDTYP